MAIEEIEPKLNVFPYMEITIGVILFKYFFNTYLELRQLRKHKIEEMPQELADLGITEKQFQESQKYSFDKKGFHMLKTAITTFFEIFLLAFKFGPMLWNYTATIPFINPQNEFVRVMIIYLITEFCINKFIQVPIDFYQNFILEEKYGFNKLTIKTYIIDELKTFTLTAILTPLVFFIYLKIVEHGGDNFFIYVEVFMIFFILIMQIIYPNFIAPWFNKFEEINEGELYDEIVKVAKQINYPLKKIYKMDGSKRSQHSNAFIFGIGSSKKIVLYDTLMKQVTTKELIAVLGHELGHWKHSHLLKKMLTIFIHIFFIFYIFGLFRNSDDLFLSFGYNEKSVLIGTTLFLQIISPISYIVELLELKVGRKQEFQADAFSASLGLSNELANGLIKLHTENLSALIIDNLYASFNYSHPALIERLKALKEQNPKLKISIQLKQDKEEENQTEKQKKD